MSIWNFFANMTGDATVTLGNTNETTVVAAGGANVFNDLLTVICINNEATAKVVTIRDGTSGTTRFTIPLPATVGATVNIPLNYPMAAAAANATWTAQQSAGSDCRVFMQVVKRLPT